MKFTKLVIFINALVPLCLLLWDVYYAKVGPNPLEFVTHTTGMLTLVFLFITLAITPLRQITGANDLIKVRRMVGLFAFFYGSTHLLTYIWFDRFFNVSSTLQDVRQRPFIAVGMTAFLLLVPLTITSNNRMTRLLGGKVWARLHRLIYLAAALGVLHYWMSVKSDYRSPLTFAFILALLLGYRIFVKYFPPQDRPTYPTLLTKD